MKNFYQKLKRPIMTAAPMSGVTDEAFRRMLLKIGRPDVFWTEFVSAEGLFSDGREKLLPILKFNKAEHPIVAQIFGANPDYFEKAAKLIKKLGFDGIDINMGCPNKDIEKRGAGAALIKNPDLVRQIIRATKKGAVKLPVSVKTRIGYNENEINKWIPDLLNENLAALTVHLRTRSEASRPPAHWELAKKIVKLRDKYAPKTLIFGNGDVKSLAQAKKLVKETDLDGIMAGRGVLADPWFFSGKNPSASERMTAFVKQVEIFEELNKNNLDKRGRIKSFDSIKRFLKGYVSGFEGAKELREALFKAKTPAQMIQTVKLWKNSLKMR